MTSAIILAQSVRKTYPTRPPVVALDGFSLEVKPGETLGLLGPNGAGKTTFIRILLGILLPDGGEVRVDHANPARQPNEVARLIRFVPELPFLEPAWTLWQNARYWFAVWEEPWDRKGLAQVLERFQLLHRADEPLSRYSRGMQQRAGLALALATRAPIIVLDEPTLGLDVLGVQETLDTLLEAKKSGKTILFASHDMPFVENLADRIALVANGRVLEVSETQAFRRRHGKEYVVMRYRLPGQSELVTKRVLANGNFSEERLWREVVDQGGTLVELKRDLQPLSMVIQHYLQEQANHPVGVNGS